MPEASDNRDRLRQRLPTLAACAGYVALLALAAIGADRVVASRAFEDPGEFVPAYRSYQDPATGVKMRQIDELEDAPDVLVIGNSRGLFGVNPVPLERSLSRRGHALEVYNAALHTVDVRFWPSFLAESYEPEPPAHIFLNVIPRDLDRRNTIAAEALDAFASSPGSENEDRTAIWRAAEETLAQLYTLRGRVNELRRVGVGGLLRNEKVARPEVEIANSRGWARFDDERALSVPELERQQQRWANRHGSIRLEPSPGQHDALERLARMVRGWGGCLTLFSIPTFYDRERWGTIEVQRAFEREITTFTERHPLVGYFDLAERLAPRFGPRMFGDGDHLNARGAERFAQPLAAVIDRVLASPRCAS